MKQLFYTLVFLLVSITSFKTVHATERNLRFRHIGAEQGLQQLVVNCVLEDAQGFMWFGTQDGLYRYDGYGMKVFKHNPSDSNSLPNNYINCLFEDRFGVIWIGTDGGGIDAYSYTLDKHTRYNYLEHTDTTVCSNIIKTIAGDKQGNVWIGTEEGLCCYKYSEKRFYTYNINLNGVDKKMANNINTIYVMNETVFIGTFGSGLLSYDIRKNSFKNYLPDMVKQTSLVVNNIRAFTSLNDNELLIGTDLSGIVVYNKSKNSFSSFLQMPTVGGNRITGMKIAGSYLYISTRGGLNLFNINTRKNISYNFQKQKPFTINSDLLSCVYIDRNGNIWLGTRDNGVSVAFAADKKFINYDEDIQQDKNAVASNIIMSVFQTNDSIVWMGTNGGELKKLNTNTGIYTYYRIQSGRARTVLSLFQDDEGMLWIGTWGGGVTVLNPTTGATKVYDKENSGLKSGTICSILQDKQGVIWMASYDEGLFSFNKQTKSIASYTVNNGLTSNKLMILHHAIDGNIWVGTKGNGLCQLDPVKGSIKKVFDYSKEAISGINVVNAIHDDGKNLWIATRSGLIRTDMNGKLLNHFSEKDGLPNDFIYAVLLDAQGNLWLSTNKGISKATWHRNTIHFRNFDMTDGLLSDEFNQWAFHKNKQGEIFFGGVNGVDCFQPLSIVDNPVAPPVYITSFKIAGKEIKLDSAVSSVRHITLSWKDNFSFEFVGLNYLVPQKNLYSYKMDGVDEDWSPPDTRRYASYTRLSGGDYVFRVKACNNDGVWNSGDLVIHIRVQPPFWRTKWFLTLAILAGIGLVLGYSKYRTLNIERYNKILEGKVEERTRELAQKNQDITSSITYAKRIQEAILLSQEEVCSKLGESFVLYKPKDIVSGDFYWYGEKNNCKIIAAVDCTGHGVPGAFMSMIGHNLLNQIVIENGITEPSAILNRMHVGVQQALKQDVQGNQTHDGMDIAICAINDKSSELTFAGAFRPLIFFRDGKSMKMDGDKFPIGGSQSIVERIFTSHKISLQKGDTVYMFSDGFADQFGGEKGKKFMIKNFISLLQNIQLKDMPSQQQELLSAMEKWKGMYEQVDDVLVIGIRF